MGVVYAIEGINEMSNTNTTSNPFDVETKPVTQQEAESMLTTFVARWDGMTDEQKLHTMQQLRPRLAYVLSRYREERATVAKLAEMDEAFGGDD